MLYGVAGAKQQNTAAAAAAAVAAKVHRYQVT
jgi:hypothetical protein